MKLPKNTNYMLIMFLIGLSIAIRYPNMSNETGVDAFVMHNLTSSIQMNGNALWIMNPLSLFGLYPASYPSGAVFLTSAFSQMGGLTVDMSILIECIVVSIIGVLAAYLLAREIKRDDGLFAFVLAFAFSLAPRFLAISIWEFPTRALFIAITPLFIWALLRVHKNFSPKNVGIGIVILLMLASFHRLAILLLIVILAYIFSFIFLTFVRILKLRYPKIFLQARTKKNLLRLSIIGFFAFAFLLLIFTDVFDAYQTGKFISSETPSILVSMMNLGVNLTRGAGLLVPLVILGVIGFSLQKNKDLKNVFLIFTLLGLIPTLILRVYTGYYIVAFSSIFIAMGVVFFYDLFKKRKKIAFVSTMVLLVASAGFSGYILSYDIETTQYLSSDYYSSGLYAKYNTQGTIIANDGLLGSKISSVSSNPYLPIGGATLPAYGPEMLAFNFFDPEEIEIVPIPIMELTVGDDSPFKIPERSVQTQRDWFFIMVKNERYSILLSAYDAQYVAESKKLYGTFNHFGSFYSSEFLISVHDERYKVYENEMEIIWYGIPE